MNKKFIVTIVDKDGYYTDEQEYPTQEEAEDIKAILLEDPNVLDVQIDAIRI